MISACCRSVDVWVASVSRAAFETKRRALNSLSKERKGVDVFLRTRFLYALCHDLIASMLFVMILLHLHAYLQQQFLDILIVVGVSVTSAGIVLVPAYDAI